MTVLSSKQILQEKETTDSNAITALTLTFKALTDVSCLIGFKNLERLDLTLNNLSSLEDLKECVNLKWLSVKQNKLRSLKGIERLTKLTVLNAGKNKLNSMVEVTSLVRLRALILNDNEIPSIPRLDQMKELNTIVLSRNPIQGIGESMVKLKLISKISLSDCQIQTIGSSLKSCTELKELRLTHNGIMMLPGELACNMKIQNLDLGNNSIGRWSNIKVLSSLSNLKNLNLQGNPIMEKETLAKKIKKLIPSLQIYNAKPIEKLVKYEKGGRVDNSSVNADNMLGSNKGEHLGQSMESGSLEQHDGGPSKDGNVNDNEDFTTEKRLKAKREDFTTEKRLKAKRKKRSMESAERAGEKTRLEDVKHHVKFSGDGKSPNLNPDPKKVGIDDDIPFTDLFSADIAENAKNHIESMKKLKKGIHTGGEIVTLPKKKWKIKGDNLGASTLQSLAPADKIGLGGPSAWDN